MRHIPINHTFLIARIVFYCVVFGGRATASSPSNALYKAILDIAKSVFNWKEEHWRKMNF